MIFIYPPFPHSKEKKKPQIMHIFNHSLFYNSVNKIPLGPI